MITLKQLAKELNVSVSTVSKALSNSDEISSETIIKVQNLAKELNYKRNKIALSLKSNKTLTLGVILPDILNRFYENSNILGICGIKLKKGENLFPGVQITIFC